jgi:hypothetical protein
MKLFLSQRVPRQYDQRAVSELFRDVEQQGNQLAEGRVNARHAAATAAPTAGDWARGDQVDNSEPSVAGSAGSQYVIVGWICTVSGSPGTWVERRTLTGT